MKQIAGSSSSAQESERITDIKPGAEAAINHTNLSREMSKGNFASYSHFNGFKCWNFSPLISQTNSMTIAPLTMKGKN